MCECLGLKLFEFAKFVAKCIVFFADLFHHWSLQQSTPQLDGERVDLGPQLCPRFSIGSSKAHRQTRRSERKVPDHHPHVHKRQGTRQPIFNSRMPFMHRDII